MAEVDDALQARVKLLNQARDRSIAGAFLGLAPTLNAVRRGESGIDTAKKFFPKGTPVQDPLAVAELKKDIITKMAATDEDIRSGKLQLAKALQSGNDLVEKVLGAAATFGGSQASAFASVQNNVRDNVRALSNDMAKTVVQALGTVDEGSAASVSRALDELRTMMSPGGVVGPEFTANLAGRLTSMSDERGKAYLMAALDQDPKVQAQGGLQAILEGSAQNRDQNAMAALQVWSANQQYVQEAAQKVANLPMAMWASTIEQMDKSGVLGSNALGNNVKELVSTLRELGMAEDLGQRERIFDKLMGTMRPSDTDPDAQKKFDKVLEDLDKPREMLDPTRQEAKRALTSSPEFRAWMEKNNLRDTDMAISILRKQVRQKVAADRASDREQAAKMTPGVPAKPEATSLTDVGATGPKAPKPGAKEPGHVMGADGMPWLWTGQELVPLDAEALDDFDQALTADPKKLDAYRATAGQFAEYQKAAEAAKAPTTTAEAAAQPAAPGAPTTGAPLPGAKPEAGKTSTGADQNTLTHGAVTIDDDDGPTVAEKVEGRETDKDPEQVMKEGLADAPDGVVDAAPAGAPAPLDLSLPMPTGELDVETRRNALQGLFDAGKKKRKEQTAATLAKGLGT